MSRKVLIKVIKTGILKCQWYSFQQTLMCGPICTQGDKLVIGKQQCTLSIESSLSLLNRPPGKSSEHFKSPSIYAWHLCMCSTVGHPANVQKEKLPSLTERHMTYPRSCHGSRSSKESRVPQVVWISWLCSEAAQIVGENELLSALVTPNGNLFLSVLASSFSPSLSCLPCFPPPLSPLSSLPPAPFSLQPLLASSLSDSNVSKGREACLSLLIHAVDPGLVNLSNNSRTWHRWWAGRQLPALGSSGLKKIIILIRGWTQTLKPQSPEQGHQEVAEQASFSTHWADGSDTRAWAPSYTTIWEDRGWTNRRLEPRTYLGSMKT